MIDVSRIKIKTYLVKFESGEFNVEALTFKSAINHAKAELIECGIKKSRFTVSLGNKTIDSFYGYSVPEVRAIIKEKNC